MNRKKRLLCENVLLIMTSEPSTFLKQNLLVNLDP